MVSSKLYGISALTICFFCLRLTTSEYVTVDAVYRTPGTHSTDITNCLRTWTAGSRLLVLGDFDCPQVDWVDPHLSGADLLSRKLLRNL